jgi:LPS O-antigen subunit length determinant protein (WzzB/FepE family)
MICLGLVNQQLFCLDMVQYTLAQSPEIILTVAGKDSAKAREKAMDQLMELMEAGNLPTELEEGFGAQQLIEVKEASIDTASGEDAITQAVQILSNLATLKLKVQDSRAEALEIRKAVDVLFSDQSVTEEEITRLKEGFKVLKNFAQANMRYQEARAKAEQARQVLDQALKSPEK